jgi:molecular chaperone GrpE
MPSSPASEGNEGAVEQRRAEERPAGDGARTDVAEAHSDQAAEVAEMEDRYKRARADLENYHKRSAQEVDRRVTESREALIGEWLAAVDSVERALRMDPENPFAEGLRAVLEQMEQILDRQGVRAIDGTGERFDPERHEAIAVRETDEVPERTVLEVERSGYAVGDRVLRPAQVVVSRHSDQA